MDGDGAEGADRGGKKGEAALEGMGPGCWMKGFVLMGIEWECWINWARLKKGLVEIGVERFGSGETNRDLGKLDRIPERWDRVGKSRRLVDGVSVEIS
jgi:hypothetical protein